MQKPARVAGFFTAAAALCLSYPWRSKARRRNMGSAPMWALFLYGRGFSATQTSPTWPSPAKPSWVYEIWTGERMGIQLFSRRSASASSPGREKPSNWKLVSRLVLSDWRKHGANWPHATQHFQFNASISTRTCMSLSSRPGAWATSGTPSY